MIHDWVCGRSRARHFEKVILCKEIQQESIDGRMICIIDLTLLIRYHVFDAEGYTDYPFLDETKKDMQTT